MTSYSALFSSGLLTTPRSHARYGPPSSPLMPSSSPSLNNSERDQTPTPSLMSTPSRSRSSTISSVLSNKSTATTQSASTTGSRQTTGPRLRKRRSSLTPAASPMPSIRSPARAVRQSILSSARARSGSLATATTGPSAGSHTIKEGKSFFGRMRSGSLNVILRPRRLLARPAVPPPSAPLPPVPQNYTSTGLNEVVGRPPLTGRAPNDENGAPYVVITPDSPSAKLGPADMDVDISPGGYLRLVL